MLIARTRFATMVFLAAAFLVASVSSATDETGQAEKKPAAGEIKKRERTQFLRVRNDEYKNPVALQTATAKYVLKEPSGDVRLEVFLESVIHVADRSYYREFNQRFSHYDAVLYELVAPAEKRVPDPQEKAHPLRLLQQVAAEGLGFVHQIDVIDYKAQNMVHADLSPDELKDASKQLGEDEFTQVIDVLLDVMRRMNRDQAAANENPPQDKPLDLSVLSDPDGAIKLRRLMAASFGANPSLEAVLRPSQIATLVRARNDRTMQVFQQQLDAGKRRIAFFYGAGHMEDFERKLILDYGLEPAGVVWRDAWDLRDGAVERSPLEAILENTLRGTLQDAVRDLLAPPKPER